MYYSWKSKINISLNAYGFGSPKRGRVICLNRKKCLEYLSLTSVACRLFPHKCVFVGLCFDLADICGKSYFSEFAFLFTYFRFVRKTIENDNKSRVLSIEYVSEKTNTSVAKITHIHCNHWAITFNDAERGWKRGPLDRRNFGDSPERDFITKSKWRRTIGLPSTFDLIVYCPGFQMLPHKKKQRKTKNNRNPWRGQAPGTIIYGVSIRVTPAITRK